MKFAPELLEYNIDNPASQISFEPAIARQLILVVGCGMGSIHDAPQLLVKNVAYAEVYSPHTTPLLLLQKVSVESTGAFETIRDVLQLIPPLFVPQM
jgi:hypothetical protein